MRKLTPLKLTILERGLTQREISRRSGLDEGRMSLACNGHLILDPIQQAQVAQALEMPVSEIFNTELTARHVG